MMFNIENCDVTMENGYLRLIYHTDKLPVPMVLAVTKSYHDLNEKAMQLFDGNDWTESVVEWNLRKEDPIWHNLLADIYVSHNDMYKKVMAVNKKEPTKYIALEFTGEKNEQGHRMGRLDFEDLKKMDYDCLKLLAKDLDVSEYDTLGPNDLAYSVSLVDIDVDDADCDYNCEDCDCAEMTDDGDYIPTSVMATVITASSQSWMTETKRMMTAVKQKSIQSGRTRLKKIPSLIRRSTSM